MHCSGGHYRGARESEQRAYHDVAITDSSFELCASAAVTDDGRTARARTTKLERIPERSPERTMPNSVWSDEVTQLCTEAQTPRNVTLTVGKTAHTIPRPFPSAEDWRDQWIYFLMVDRFNNPQNAPNHLPFDAPFGRFQGGNF